METFLNNLKHKIREFLLKAGQLDANGMTQGFFWGIDSVEQVMAAIETFPSILSTRDTGGVYPVLWQAGFFQEGNYRCNVNAVLFIPTMVQVGIESNTFADKDERGGLFFQVAVYWAPAPMAIVTS